MNHLIKLKAIIDHGISDAIANGQYQTIAGKNQEKSERYQYDY